MKTGAIRQTVQLPGTPEEVYAALMTTRGHQAFTGAAARISPRVGGAFMAWGGYIHGKNLRLGPGRLIVQAWRPSEDSWPERHCSTVTFVLTPNGKGTHLKFTHSNVPIDHVEHLSKGWKESYWDPLTRYLKSQSTKGHPPSRTRVRRERS